MTRFLSLSLITLIVGFCLTMLVDCSCAKPDWHPGTVTDKIIDPPWTEFQSDGKGHMSTIYHPERYVLVASVDGSTGRLEVWQGTYDSFHTGDPCEVQFRHGHLMTYGYLGIRRGAW